MTTANKYRERVDYHGKRYRAKTGYPHMPYAQEELSVTKRIKEYGNPDNDLYEFITESGKASTCRASWLRCFWNEQPST